MRTPRYRYVVLGKQQVSWQATTGSGPIIDSDAAIHSHVV